MYDAFDTVAILVIVLSALLVSNGILLVTPVRWLLRTAVPRRSLTRGLPQSGEDREEYIVGDRNVDRGPNAVGRGVHSPAARFR